MQKKIICVLALFSLVNGQASLSDINRLNDKQIEAIKSKLDSNTITEPVEEVDLNPVYIPTSKLQQEESDYFGYNYFKREINFFDNTPTPSNYKLGPGDEIIISLWGETNSRTNVVINKEGMIYYENIGFINLSNQTLESAELLLTEELSRIYSTLKDEANPTTLMLELGKLKSINIYFSGHIVNPGINLIHPFSDIFSAIVQAGGVNNEGSLREVQLIRSDKIIAKVDFYSFFMDGENTFSNVKLIDGDVIHIPNVKKRVSISGEVIRPSSYELLSDDSISSIITYASGFTSDASSSIILNQIIPVKERLSDDNARTNIALNFKNSLSKALNNGDSIKVLPITNVDLNVEIYGRVKSPGAYPANDSSLKYVLDIAGGFDDPVFRQTIREDEIKILRKDSNQFYAIELTTSYNEADKLQLLPNDKIFVYENINYRNSFTYRVEGEVYKPGTYPFSKKITVSDAIESAEGLTSLSSIDNVIVFQEYTELDENDEEITKSESVGNVNGDFVLGPNSVLKALPFENVVRVEGNVYNPGLIAFYKGLTMYDAIEQAGGHMPYSMKKSSYVRRANGEVDKANLFRGRIVRINPGDTVVVPVNPNPSDFDISTFVADLSSTLANIAAILLIVDNQKD